MSKIDLKVPNIGDFKDVEVIEVLIKEGENINKNDPLITIESDKSSVEIPSTENGKILKLFIKVGDKVSEGDKILEIETVSSTKNEKNKNLINNNENKKEVKKINKENLENQKIEINYNEGVVLASPKTRKFARELGVDINSIKGSQLKGRVDEADIKKFVSLGGKNLAREKPANKKIELEFEHHEFGSVEKKDIPRVKKLASTYLMNSWSNIPHVTNHDEADITELENFRSSLTDIYTGEKKKITPLAFIVKALTATLKKFPSFNSSIDEIESGKMTLKKHYQIGIAVYTKKRLIVTK